MYNRVIEMHASVVFSIVSHGQLNLVANFLSDFQNFNLKSSVDLIVLTLNIEEDEGVLKKFSGLPIKIIRNNIPKGFGDNHNCAFDSISSDFFVIVNPDIRLVEFSLRRLLDSFHDDIGACAPLVLSPQGVIEDSARRFPTLSLLLSRFLSKKRSSDYVFSNEPVVVDWCAGMFVVYRSIAFKSVDGFDTGYFMYMEDADICRRLKMSRWKTIIEPRTSVVHDAQRASHRSLRHLRWHLQSAIRFLFLTK